MPKKSPIAVLLPLEDRALAERVRTALADASFRLSVHVESAAAAPNDGPRAADVIVIPTGQMPPLAPRLARRVARGETAILAIGLDRSAENRDAPADPVARDQMRAERRPAPEVVLPSDAAPREIALACRLLAENVRLRHRLRKTRRHRGQLAQLAESDPLTGLANRRAWQRELLARLHDVTDERNEHCLAIVDLDFFKPVNDAHGYAAGDRLLAAVATALRQAVRTGDFVARLGGDEFGLLLANIDQRAAAAIIGRVRARVGAEPLLAAQAVTASAGYVVFAAGRGLDETALLAAADRALREAKGQGRNQAVAAGALPAQEAPSKPAG